MLHDRLWPTLCASLQCYGTALLCPVVSSLQVTQNVLHCFISGISESWVCCFSVCDQYFSHGFKLDLRSWDKLYCSACFVHFSVPIFYLIFLHLSKPVLNCLVESGICSSSIRTETARHTTPGYGDPNVVPPQQKMRHLSSLKFLFKLCRV